MGGAKRRGRAVRLKHAPSAQLPAEWGGTEGERSDLEVQGEEKKEVEAGCSRDHTFVVRVAGS